MFKNYKKKQTQTNNNNNNTHIMVKFFENPLIFLIVLQKILIS